MYRPSQRFGSSAELSGLVRTAASEEVAIPGCLGLDSRGSVSLGPAVDLGGAHCSCSSTLPYEPDPIVLPVVAEQKRGGMKKGMTEPLQASSARCTGLSRAARWPARSFRGAGPESWQPSPGGSGN